MSNDQKYNISLSVNTLLTACTTIIVAMAGWVVTGKLKEIHDAQTIAIKDFQHQADNTYESQVDYNKDLETQRQINSKFWTQFSAIENKMDSYHSDSMQEFGKLDTEYQILMNAVEKKDNK